MLHLQLSPNMPSFAFHPINRISRSISSPNALASQNQTKVVSVVTSTRSRNAPTTPSSSPSDLTYHRLSHLPSSSQSSHSFTTPTSDERLDMHRLNPLNFISAVTSQGPPHHHAESNKPPPPVFSSSASSASYNPQLFSHHKSYSNQNVLSAPADLPPVSPMSSLYDANSPDLSADGSRISDDDSATTARLSSSSASDSLDRNVFLRPPSTLENRIRSNDFRNPVVNDNAPTWFQDQNLGPPVAFRRTLFATKSVRSPVSNPPALPSRSREKLFAGIAARGKVVDAFIANPHDASKSVEGMPRVMSGKSLEIPRGKVEQLPVPRPATPCQVPRPETPSRLPRPRVFIEPSQSRHSIVDPVAVTRDSEMRPGEAEFVTREIPRPTTPAPGPLHYGVEPNTASGEGRSVQEDFYFSDEEHVEDDVSECRLDPFAAGPPTPSDLLSYKVRRAVSALRSISFQSHNPDDLETAWGQANTGDTVREKSNASGRPNRWRRACGRISSKNGVQEYECRSEADVHSISSYNSNYSAQKDRSTTNRDQLRGIVGVPLRADHGSRLRRSLWTGGKRDRQPSPQTRAAELLLSNGQGLLAASTDLYDNGNALTAVPPFEHADLSDHARSSVRRGSVDKYVEFIHASAHREARNRNQYRTLRSRIVNRMFRRRWN